jgi:hypothetical protein
MERYEPDTIAAHESTEALLIVANLVIDESGGNPLDLIPVSGG